MTCIAILFANFGPYHLARVRAAANHISTQGLNIIGLELAREEEEYAWKISTEKLSFPLVTIGTNSSLERQNFFLLIIRLWRQLDQKKPDAICISGYARPTMLVALVWCQWNSRPAILMSETTAGDFQRKSWREWLKAWIVKQFSAALVGGKPQARYLQSLGFPKKAISFGYDVVNNADFHPQVISHSAAPQAKPYFLMVNRFIPKKNLTFLLSCYAAYRSLAASHPWDLVLCGDGELRPQLEHQVKTLGMSDSVHLPGFLQQDQLLPYFAYAGCFIHASIQEQWGLVVNEAMAAGLPVVVSNRCGCFEDLVIEGVNGFGFDPENAPQLIELMVRVSSDQIDRQALGKAALQHIQNYSPDQFAQGLKQALGYALSHR